MPNQRIVIIAILTAFSFYAVHKLTEEAENVRGSGIGQLTNGVEQGAAGMGGGAPPSFKTLDQRRRFPDVIVAGTKKGGTKFLLEVLRTHSQLAMPWLETHFFDHFKIYNYSWYIRHFPMARPDQLVVEKTPRYFTSPNSPGNASMLPDVKILVSLRNPVIRTISDYLMYGRVGRQEGTLQDMIILPDGSVNQTHRLVRFSIYSNYMPRWLALFKLGETLEVVDGDNLVKKPWEEFERIQNFLGVEHQITRETFVFSKEKGFYCFRMKKRNEDTIQCLDKGKGHQHTEVIPKSLEQKLEEFFRPHNEKLFDMLGRTFNWSSQSVT